ELKQLKKEPEEKPLKLEIVYDYMPGININEALHSVIENAPFEIVSKKVNRKHSLTAENFSDDILESVDELSDEEIFKRLFMSKTAITEMDEQSNKTFEEYLPLFMQIVEEVNQEMNNEGN
ncbi:MAG: hypothetical protein UH678_08650, partial [Fibrobacteraceae bacterium]|nr:hypothetical protein [Fibrobacteraceae bacterium]